MPTWTSEITFLPNGDAVRAGNVLVDPDDVTEAVEALGWDVDDEGDVPNRLVLLTTDPGESVVEAMATLHALGIRSQPNHVLFVPCGPSRLGSTPVHASAGVYASPVHASSIMGSGCCGCCPPHPAGTGPGQWRIQSKVVASPVHASPVHASTYMTTGARASTVRPATEPANWSFDRDPGDVVVAIIDTGLAQAALLPPGLSTEVPVGQQDVPNADPPPDTVLDPVAGHGTFIAGVIAQRAITASMRHIGLVGPCGDLDEHALAKRIRQLITDGEVPAVLNLSLAGYASAGMADLAMAVRDVQRLGTIVVAAAGNDATCEPTYPAVLPGVVGVGAVGANERAAAFTNYGPWVRACSFGVDIVSYFFVDWQGDWRPQEDPLPQDAVDVRDGWATWSGTSFAAPYVAGCIAQELIVNGVATNRATARVRIDAVLDTSMRSVPELGRLVV